jgi:hypothetical protein
VEPAKHLLGVRLALTSAPLGAISKKVNIHGQFSIQPFTETAINQHFLDL